MNKISILHYILVACVVCAEVSASVKDFDPKIDSQYWGAHWAWNSKVPLSEYAVLHFRRSFDIKEKPDSFKVNVTADQRFVLYVNGICVARGPARSDLYNWYYDTIDIAPQLREGKNTIAALVWHAGNSAPVAQMSRRLAFILDGATENEEFLATPSKWKVKKSEAYSPIKLNWFVGPGDAIDGKKYDWGWTLPEYDDSGWRNADTLDAAYTSTSKYGDMNWMLKPRRIPQMGAGQVRLKSIRRFSGVGKVSDFISGKSKFTVPANAKCTLLLDNGVLTNAYPVLKTSRGAGASVTLKYAEALFDASGQKGNRNDIEGRSFNKSFTVTDRFLPDGGLGREFSPLWFRTYRYVGVDIETKEEPLVIEDLYGDFTGYPFEENGSFVSDDESIEKIWEVGWRTARLCAVETYMDCPYYEQLQYVGDTRIQALISLYVSGDDRLMRQAISAFQHSCNYLGITQSRYPSRKTQYIPPFSLYWISMLNDYALHRNDKDFLEGKLDCVRNILSWYEKQIDPSTGLLKPRIPFWNFVDWSSSDPATKGEDSTGWNIGVAPEGKNAGSAITTLHLALTLKEASDLMRHMGYHLDSDKYLRMHDKIIKAVVERCWNAERGVFVDYEGAVSSSQHVNIMAILAGAVPESGRAALMDKILNDASLTQCTFYYRFYLTEAMRKSGMGDMYISQLKPWRDMIKIGLTTFAENPEPARSDCHAWSSSPNYHLLSLVAGITPRDYGFKTITVKPNFGGLKKIRAKMPHPNGIIEVDISRDGAGVGGSVTLPEGTNGEFIWLKNKIPLVGGNNKIECR